MPEDNTRCGCQLKKMEITMTRKMRILSMLLVAMLAIPAFAIAQEATDTEPLDPLPTIISVKTSAGWGIGRARQLYGYNGQSEVWWSTGQGAKMNLALDVPVIQIDVVDSSNGGLGKTPLVGLEIEAATGYYLSTGGTTNEQFGSGFRTTTRTTSYVPITLGFNARSSFGAGMPSIYLGAGGGIYLVGIYEEHVSNSTDGKELFTRTMNPPVPFALYGALGMEFPLLYSVDDGNSALDLFTELRFTDMTSYVYQYQETTPSGGASTVNPRFDSNEKYVPFYQRSSSNLAITLGLKFNIY